jgi:hypothetical protein
LRIFKFRKRGFVKVSCRVLWVVEEVEGEVWYVGRYVVVLGGVRVGGSKVSATKTVVCCFGGCFRKLVNNIALPHSNRRAS